MSSDPQVALALPPGAVLDHYEINRTLGQGAFGVTYQSYSHRFKAPCVIKELLPVDFATRASKTLHIIPLVAENEAILEKCRADFMREATILHEVNHPNVVKILDFFGGNGTNYMVMPYEDGSDYERYLKKLRQAGESPSEQDLMRLLHPVLDGLVCVHAKGFLHRDIKPENILVTAKGEPLLIDFGAARQVIGSRSRPISMILTPKYAPFEQYSSTKKQGPYTDIYSLAAVMHRAIAGEPPPEAPDRADGDDKYIPLVDRFSRHYSSQFLQAIDWALRPQSHLRPQTIDEWRQALPRATNAMRPVVTRVPSPQGNGRSEFSPPPLPEAPPPLPLPLPSRRTDGPPPPLPPSVNPPRSEALSTGSANFLMLAIGGFFILTFVIFLLVWLLNR